MTAPNPESLKLVKDHGRPAVAFAVARIPGTGRVFLGSSDFKVTEGDLAAAKFEPTELYAHGSYVTTLALAGTALVSGGYDGKLVWWDTEKKKELRRLDAHAKWIRQVTVSPDGKLVASVADDMVCKLWDAASGKLVRELRGHAEKTPHHFSSMLYAVAFSPDGKHLATADKTAKVVVWDVASGKQLKTVEAPVMYTWDPVQRLHSIGGARSLAFSPDGAHLAVGGTGKIGNIDHLEANGRVEVFDWRAEKRVAELVLDKSKGLVNKLAYAPDGAWLLAVGGAGEGFVAFLDVAGKKVLKQEKVAMHVHDISVTPTFDSLVLAGHNKVATYKMG
jgi:WD40 repeat protein